jgi:hypothetical protein
MSVRVRPDVRFNSELAVVTRDPKLYTRRRLLCPNLLIDKLTTFVEIINPTDVTQTLNVGTKLGKISEYDDIPIPLFKTDASVNPPHTQSNLTSISPSFRYILHYQKPLQPAWKDKFASIPRFSGQSERVTFDIDTGDAPSIKRQQFPHPEKIHNQIKEHVDKMSLSLLLSPKEERRWDMGSRAICERCEGFEYHNQEDILSQRSDGRHSK